MKFFLLLFLVFILSLLISCNSELISDSKLEKEFEHLSNSMQSEPLCMTFRLDSIADFEWDTVIVLTPYLYIEKLEKKLNIDLHPLYSCKITVTEGTNVLAFIKNHKLIKFVEFPITSGEFNIINDSRIFTKNRSTFKYKQTLNKFSDGKFIYEIEECN